MYICMLKYINDRALVLVLARNYQIVHVRLMVRAQLTLC